VTKRPPPGATPGDVKLFIDRDLWSRALDTALREAGIPFVAHRDLFDDDVPDAEWLARIAPLRLVVVTRDQRIRYRPNEVGAVRRGRLHLFALSSGNLGAAESGRLLVAAWPRIEAAVRDHAPPMIWTLTRGGQVRPVGR
jgi:hypothetical protein